MVLPFCLPALHSAWKIMRSPASTAKSLCTCQVPRPALFNTCHARPSIEYRFLLSDSIINRNLQTVEAQSLHAFAFRPAHSLHTLSPVHRCTVLNVRYTWLRYSFDGRTCTDKTWRPYHGAPEISAVSG